MFSQNNEEKFILDYFKDFMGTFLDVGANDGITLSNTRALYEKGWKGTLIEASPVAYERLLKNYKDLGCVVVNCAVCSYKGTIILHESGELLSKGDVALVSSTRDDEIKRWETLNIPFTDVVVQACTFEEAIGYAKHRHTKYDFISIDIEGMEPEVVPQINFTELGVKMAIIEWNGKNGELYDGLLLAHGLKLIHTNAENRIYTR